MSELVRGPDRLVGATMAQNPASGPVQSADEAEAWHALYTRHQHEKNAARVLGNKGFDIFLPLYTAEHRWKDRTKTLALPLFPCYVFLRGGLDRRIDILSTPGVHSLVRQGDQVAIISEQEIQAVRRVVANCLQVEPHPFLRCGDRVRVKVGPLAGIEGILVRKKDQFRLILSVDLLHRSIAVEVERTAVEPLHRSGLMIETSPHVVAVEFACANGEQTTRPAKGIGLGVCP